MEAEYACTVDNIKNNLFLISFFQDLKEEIFRLDSLIKSNTVAYNAQLLKKEQEIEEFNLQKRV